MRWSNQRRSDCNSVLGELQSVARVRWSIVFVLREMPFFTIILVRTGVGVAHCSVSNAKLGSGVVPVPEMLARGIPVVLGTDSMLSNNGQDMFAEMKCAVLVQRAVRRNVTVDRAQDVLEMATTDAVGSVVGVRACPPFMCRIWRWWWWWWWVALRVYAW
ncbi:MAG: amidohydrolase family protein [Rhodococcus sp. (in: high G+C Gram-positive bacteria)]